MELDKNSIEGLPNGWKVYTDVFLIKADVDVDQQLQHLLPLSAEIAPSISDGTQISRGVWHTKSQIKIHFTSDKSPTRIELIQPSVSEAAITNEISDTRSVSLLPALSDGTYTLNFYADEKESFQEISL